MKVDNVQPTTPLKVRGPNPKPGTQIALDAARKYGANNGKHNGEGKTK